MLAPLPSDHSPWPPFLLAAAIWRVQRAGCGSTGRPRGGGPTFPHQNSSSCGAGVMKSPRRPTSVCLDSQCTCVDASRQHDLSQPIPGCGGQIKESVCQELGPAPGAGRVRSWAVPPCSSRHGAIEGLGFRGSFPAEAYLLGPVQSLKPAAARPAGAW